MKRCIALVLVCGLISPGLFGCGEKVTTKKETEIKTPGGKTTITTETEVKKTGENPPPAQPWDVSALESRRGQRPDGPGASPTTRDRSEAENGARCARGEARPSFLRRDAMRNLLKGSAAVLAVLFLASAASAAP